MIIFMVAKLNTDEELLSLMRTTQLYAIASSFCVFNGVFDAAEYNIQCLRRIEQLKLQSIPKKNKDSYFLNVYDEF